MVTVVCYIALKLSVSDFSGFLLVLPFVFDLIVLLGTLDRIGGKK